MFGFGGKRTEGRVQAEQAAMIAAINRVQALIWFAPDGTILDANQNFLDLLGYELDDIRGQHHAIFVYPRFVQTEAYRDMWRRLMAGEFVADTFPRLTKTGAVVWITASYNPIFGPDGKVAKVVKFATDVTRPKRAADEARGKMAAISRSQAVIEFDLDGIILSANRNFLETVGYSEDEVIGKHHAMFLFPGEADSEEYRDFWRKLNAGEFVSGLFRRRHRDGHSVYLGATYNPLLDGAGKPWKVVKFARDRTDEQLRSADMSGQINALRKSVAVIEFDLDGTILDANDNFLSLFGYRLEEVQGRKHAMFLPKDESSGPGYALFWKDLAAGGFREGEFRRIDRHGRDVWIQGSYNPILGVDGVPVKVVKFAQDITARRAAVNALIRALGQLSEGILTARISEDLSPEFEGLRRDFNHTVERLREVLNRVLSNGHQLHGEIRAIAESTEELGARTERQAASLEETAAAMEELAGMVRDAAGAATEARDSVGQASDIAERGGTVVARTVAAMDAIAESSEKISKITSVIDDIAFQTNLLALNAGVEAARAGESGRGFAVVAAEVRALALRSAGAAQQIAELISVSSGQVREGVDLVGQTGAALDEIRDSVSGVQRRVERITALAEDQNGSIVEINSAVSDLDRTTQQNAAMFEEITAATQTLGSTANDLLASGEEFTLTEIAAPDPAEDAAAAARSA